MKKLSVTTLLTAVAVCTAGAAFAGSPIPVYEEPEPYYPIVPEPSWEGFYVGLIGGFQTGDLIDTDTDTTYPFDTTNYGGMAGYNFQKDQFVFGGEIDVQFGSGTLTVPGILDDPTTVATTDTELDFDVDYLIDLRGRMGYAMDSVLVYAAGGYTTAKYSVDDDSLEATGWNIGAGIDFAVNDKFIVGGEYIYRDLDGETDGDPFDLNSHGFQLRAGLRF